MALLIVPATTRSQVGDSEDRRSRIAFEVELVQAAQLVPAISPNRYSGLGWAAALSYRRLTRTSVTALALSLTHATMEAVITSDGTPADRMNLLALDVAYAPKIDRLSSAGVSTYLGAQLGAHVDVDEHEYGGVYAGGSDTFGYAALTIGPIVGVELATGAGRFGGSLVFPLAGLADFPYINGKVEHRLRLRPVTIADLQSVDSHLSYHRAFTGGWGVIWSYHLVFLRSSRHDVRRYARQGLSMTISGPLGRRP
jgi:hypothetical protein